MALRYGLEMYAPGSAKDSPDWHPVMMDSSTELTFDSQAEMLEWLTAFRRGQPDVPLRQVEIRDRSSSRTRR